MHCVIIYIYIYIHTHIAYIIHDLPRSQPAPYEVFWEARKDDRRWTNWTKPRISLLRPVGYHLSLETMVQIQSRPWLIRQNITRSWFLVWQGSVNMLFWDLCGKITWKLVFVGDELSPFQLSDMNNWCIYHPLWVTGCEENEFFFVICEEMIHLGFFVQPLEKSGFADSWNWYCFSSMGIASIAGLIRLNFKHGRRWGSNCFGHTLRSGPKHGHCHFTLAGLIWQYHFPEGSISLQFNHWTAFFGAFHSHGGTPSHHTF